jgi:glycosyltransferase involved in cell wall biosynthesis
MVIHYPFFGGPHNQALRLSEPLADRGFETTVVLPAESGNAASRLRSGGVPVIEIPLHRLRASKSIGLQARFASNFYGDIQRIRKVIRETHADVVEVNGLVNPQAAIAGRLEGVPIVWQLLDTRPPMVLRRLLMPVVRRLSGVVMSTGAEVARVHPGALSLGERLVVFFPPVDVAQFRPDRARRVAAREELGLRIDGPVVGTVANITPQKGLEYFLGAAREVRASIPNAQFVILGRPMETQEGYAASIAAAAEGFAVITDPGSRVNELLPAFDVFVMSAVPRSEGISTTVLEAMACGVPVVTTDVGSLREAVVDGVTGFVVAVEDASSIARSVVVLLRDDDRREAFARAARERAEAQFDLDTCADIHLHAMELARSHNGH